MKSAEELFQQAMDRLRWGIHWQDHPMDVEEVQHEALALFERALAQQPTHLGALRQKGLLLALFGRHDEALDAFVTVAGVSSADADLYFEVAQSLLHLGKREGALDAFATVLRLRPDDVRTLAEYAATLMTLGRNEAALSAWDALLSRPGAHPPETWLSRARTLARLQRPEALAAFTEVLERHPRHSPFPALFREDLRDHEPARSAFHAHLEAHAGEPAAWRRARQTWRDAGRDHEATQARDRLVALEPGSAQEK